MNLRWNSLAAGVWAGVLLFVNCAAGAEPRFIRLRNELIDTEQVAHTTTAPRSSTLPPSEIVSGLFLIQFRDHVQPAWSADLATHHAALLNYVPDDAFVARFDGADLTQIRALPFVRWVGPYLPEHKLHVGLRAASQAQPQKHHRVTVVLSSKAAPPETRAVRALFLSLSQQAHHRFGDVWRGIVPGHLVSMLAASPAVLWVEPGPRFKLNDETASRIAGGDGVGHATFTHELGFDGRGVRVAVADSGLHTGQTNDMHPDLLGRVPAFFFYGNLSDASDEHSHGTHVAGIIAGNGATGEFDEFDALYGLGVAPGAAIVAQRLFDGAGGYEAPPSFEVLTHDAVRAGAEIGSNSWGDDTQGRYDVSAAEFDALVRDADADAFGDQQYVLEFSAGNAGPGEQTIGSPAVAKNVIATGASQNNRFDFLIYSDGQEAMADFSSRGPAEDGRIKPDVVAPGTWIASLRSEYADDNNAWAPISDFYMYQGGTSQAGPHVSGAAAVFIQYYRETYASGTPSPALVKAALINSAVDMDDDFGTAPVPNMDEGWGRVDLTEIIGSDRAHEFIDQTNLLVTGQVHERHVIISSTNQPLKITMAYTDYPGFPAVLPALVNDLDLEVIAPDGRVYHGNQIYSGESVPDAPGFDNLNNVEGVHVGVPQAGDYVVRIIARNVAQDSRLDTPAPDQDFALVICGDILPPEAGIILFDRSAYRAPGVVKIKLIDADLVGQPSVSVMVWSATSTNGVSVTLTAQNSASGILTGGVATALGPAANDGKLHLAHGDWIRVDYYDAADSVFRSAYAVADLQPPVISQVTVTNVFGQTVVGWLTDEPANAVVRYNTNSTSLVRAATNFVITTQHEVELTNLTVGRTYYYRIESTDIAGNTASNGTTLSFVAQPTATVLLVNNYIPENDFGTPFIPVSVYTDTLAQVGVSFDVWNATNASGSGSALPTFNTLRPYPIVIWRINDSFWLGDSIPGPQQTAIQQYLNAGGAFFMSSMEILSRLGVSSSFRTNSLHVQQYIFKPDPFIDCPTCDEDIGVQVVEGNAIDPVTKGILTALDYSNYPEDEFFGIGPDLSDTFTVATNAAAMMFSGTTGKPCGVRFPRTGQDSTGRVVFCSFPLDAIPETGAAPNTRAAFLRNVIQFLAPDFSGLGTIALNQEEYRLPDLVTVEVADADLAGGPGPQVFFHSDSDSVPVSILLQETTRPGLFRGFIPLVASTEPHAPGRLRAAHDDTIYAEYFDAAVTVSASALIDNVAPAISGILITPGYDDAIITWGTDEPADALVQFGESTFLSRTAYGPDLEYDHEIQLTGLVPDRLYYFQVVSRDRAGNAGVADNGGTFYFFRTLQPLRPPFYDSMDSTGTNWSVFSGEDSGSHWTNGSPNNGVETMAHSAPHCWGSSLYGDNQDTIDTFLISPAIDLTGGNVATLRFWHSYDFTEKTGFDILEGGELLLITNTLSAPVTLAEYYDGNFVWEEEQFDLTPHVGRIVFLVWHHQLLSFESAPRPGWLLDDVSITMSNVPPVTLRVTNNLAQARFTLGGQVSRAGQGYGTTVSNIPPGTYTVTWNAVPYYLIPPRQTNTIASGGSATFTGIYGFADANANGISDAWELQYFGSVSPARTAYTDTDGDGFTDYAEFIAGTNPTLPNSHLRLYNQVALPGGSNLLQWPAVPGRIYQVQGTPNFSQWIPLTPWLQATSNSLSHPFPSPAPGQPYIHRLEVRP